MAPPDLRPPESPHTTEGNDMSATSAAPAKDATGTNWFVAIGHGLSQIFFQANIWTALLILAAFVVADWRMALLVLIGCAGSMV